MKLESSTCQSWQASHLTQLTLMFVLVVLSGLGINLNADTNLERKNVLFIAVDDLRAELGCYGSQTVQSPNIDKLADTGMVFERAYCQQSVCNPSRTSLMTGLRPDTIGVTGNHIHFRSRLPNVVTLPQHFKNNGYHAVSIGKLYHGVFPEGASKTKWDTMGDPDSWSEPAIRFGPRYYYTEQGIQAARRAFQKSYRTGKPDADAWTEKLVFGLATESPDVPDDTLYDGQVANAAIQKLADLKEQGKPFFMGVGFIKPHSPYIAPKKYFELYENLPDADEGVLPIGAPKYAGHGSGELRRYTDQPDKGEIPDENQLRVRQAYYACISYIDAQVGRVLNALERLDLAENTVVCLYGDHGYHLGEQGLWGKTTNFELDTRVPLIVRVPGLNTAGQKTRSLVELVDLFPTLSQLCGLSIGKHLDGQSFTSLLANPQARTKNVALSQYPRPGLMGYSMRTATHRLTHWVSRDTGAVRNTELYEYANDLIERENLANDKSHQRTLDALNKQFEQAFSISGDSRFASDENSTSFEKCKAGEFGSVATNVGTWSNVTGRVLIDNKHAKTGSQCLQIAGGKRSSVQLQIAEGIQTNGQLSFWAERWTSRAPFSFRIEKFSGGKWTEIYDGEKEVQVGRSFRSNIKLPLDDPEIKKLRFSVVSPENTGVLIDDLKISPAEPMTIKSVEVVPIALPALVGAKQSAIVKLKIVTDGTLEPIAMTELGASLVGRSSDINTRYLQPFYTGGNPAFHWKSQFGNPRTPRQGNIHKFVDKQELQEGDNYVWLACLLKQHARIDETVGATIEFIKFSNGESWTLGGTPSIQRLGVAIRNRGDDGVHTYRIPGLATTNKGTLIGVYDVRYKSGGDLPGHIDVGMSRSTDGGRTWQPMKVIMDMGSDPKWNGDGIGDPSVLVDRKTGTIWVSATWSHGNRSWRGSGPGLEPDETGQWILVKSDDDGQSWSKPINITRQVKRPEWCFLLQGPGKGIMMADGTLVLPAQFQDPPDAQNRTAHRLPHSTFIFSRDHGTTWNTAAPAWDDTTEAQIVELADGELMINCRNNRASKRAILTTRDMGKTWQTHSTHIKDLIEPGSCMASLINVGRELDWREIPHDFGNNFLMYSNPNSLRGRNHITIKASLDAGKTWLPEHQLLLDEQTGAGYSCMTMIDSETVGILYEGSQAHMTFQRVKLKDILDPPPNQKTRNPNLSMSSPKTPAAKKSRLAVARVFGNNMVLQTGKPVRIWGTSKPNKKIQASFMKTSRTTTSDVNGNWILELPPCNQYVSDGQSLVLKSGLETVALNNILVGEVWFCAGQSNMQWPLAKTTNGQDAIKNSTSNQIRLLNFKGKPGGSSGVYKPVHSNALTIENFSSGEWHSASPETTKNFSAIGYYFANSLQTKLECPIGIINVAAGGTPIEAWIPISDMKKHKTLSKTLNGNWLDNPVLGEWCRGRAKYNLKRGLSGEFELPGDEYGPNHSFKPGFMHAASVAPFQPMSLRGVVWYQGESNAGTPERIRQYEIAFPVLINSWRAGFKEADLPCVFAQLPAMNREFWPLFREQQRRSQQAIANCGMAISIDTGEKTNVHPKQKRPVAQRMARWALVNVYGKNGIASGPLPIAGCPARNGKLTIQFTHSGSGLKTIDNKSSRHFEVAGANKTFVAATAIIKAPDIVEVFSEKVPSPRFVRYAWKAFPEPKVNLVNSENLPATPFLLTVKESK